MQSIDSLSELAEALSRPSALIELAVLACCLGLAWLLVTRVGRRITTNSGIFYGAKGYDGVAFPLVMLGMAMVARWALAPHIAIGVFRVAVPVLASLAVVRILVRVLEVAFPGSKLIKALERTFSWLVWLGLALWFTGLLPMILGEMEAIQWHIGGSAVSLRSLLEGAISACVVLVLALWLSATIEARLLETEGLDISMRKMAANATRAALLIVALLLALSAAGIPLGALSVMGGALGVGIGLGLQKLASNYVSGFVLLAERSLRIGDTVKVDNFEGRITDITTRYTVIRALNGRESIVPNELLITQRVENSSFADPKVAITTVVQVAYGTDLHALFPKLIEAVSVVPRVLADPGPGVLLEGFGADGLNLKVAFWIADPQNGQGNAASDVNMAILATLNANGVQIPFPQRVLHAEAAKATDAALTGSVQTLPPG